MLWALRVLRESVRHHRPVSMPNLIRLYRRRLSGCKPAQAPAISVEAGVSILTMLYRTEQPFRTTDWSHHRRELMAGD